jgi:hypothetical protein
MYQYFLIYSRYRPLERTPVILEYGPEAQRRHDVVDMRMAASSAITVPPQNSEVFHIRVATFASLLLETKRKRARLIASGKFKEVEINFHKSHLSGADFTLEILAPYRKGLEKRGKKAVQQIAASLLACLHDLGEGISKESIIRVELKLVHSFTYEYHLSD